MEGMRHDSSESVSLKRHPWLRDQSNQSMAKQSCLYTQDEFLIIIPKPPIDRFSAQVIHQMEYYSSLQQD